MYQRLHLDNIIYFFFFQFWFVAQKIACKLNNRIMVWNQVVCVGLLNNFVNGFMVPTLGLK